MMSDACYFAGWLWRMESCGPCILWTEVIPDNNYIDLIPRNRYYYIVEENRERRVDEVWSGVRGGLAIGAGPSSGALKQ